jgi:hypothetical protein
MDRESCGALALTAVLFASLPSLLAGNGAERSPETGGGKEPRCVLIRILVYLLLPVYLRFFRAPIPEITGVQVNAPTENQERPVARSAATPPALPVAVDGDETMCRRELLEGPGATAGGQGGVCRVRRP